MPSSTRAAGSTTSAWQNTSRASDVAVTRSTQPSSVAAAETSNGRGSRRWSTTSAPWRNAGATPASGSSAVATSTSAAASPNAATSAGRATVAASRAGTSTSTVALASTDPSSDSRVTVHVPVRRSAASLTITSARSSSSGASPSQAAARAAAEARGWIVARRGA